MDNLKECIFCQGSNTLIQEGTKIWLGTRYGSPTHYEIRHWCDNNKGTILLKGKTELEVLNKWNRE
jgi:hypothetical protein